MRRVTAEDTDPGVVLVLVIVLPARRRGVLHKVCAWYDLLYSYRALVYRVLLFHRVIYTVDDTHLRCNGKWLAKEKQTY